MRVSQAKKGFITIATGKVFYPLAKHLYMSYKLNSNGNYPFYCLTDGDGMKELEGYFDKLIEMKNLSYSYLDKLKLAEYACFEETVFIDADSSVIDDISYIFDILNSMDYEVTVIGNNFDCSDIKHSPSFDKALLAENGINYYVTFNGGVYIFKNNEESRKIFDYAQNAIKLYQQYKMPNYSRGVGDEPLMQLAMSNYGCKAIEMKESNDFSLCLVNYSDLQVDVVNRKCSFYKNGHLRTPKILHWGTELTRILPQYGIEYLKVKKAYMHKKATINMLENIGIHISAFFRKAKYKIKSMKRNHE